MPPVPLLQGKTLGSGAVRGWLSGEPAALRTSSRHPARRATEPTVGLLARGSLPVTAFPGLTQWPVVRARRLQLRGQLRIWKEVSRTAFPVGSFAGKRPSIGGIRGGATAFVNAGAACCDA